MESLVSPVPTAEDAGSSRAEPELLRRLTIVVIHHRTPELLQRCLERLERHATAARVVVIDTSGGTSAAKLQQRHPDVEVVAAANHSLAAAANTGFRLARTAVVAHMNADVLVEAETFPRLLRALEEPGVGMVGPLCLTPDGAPQDLGLLYRWNYLRLRLRRPWWGDDGVATVAVPWLSGCLQVVKRTVLERCGGLDASFRFYNEDLEWCLRLRRAGFTCLLVDAPAVHLGGSSTPARAAFLIEGFRGGMVVSRRYRPRWYRRLHRQLVLTYARRRARHEADPERRWAYTQVARIFAEGRFDESPFGDSLFVANPEFAGVHAPPPAEKRAAAP